VKAVIYCRVSTDDQDKEGTSLKTQLRSCLEHCKRKGYEVAHRFTETYSGLTLERPHLAQIRNLVRNNQVDVLVIYCLDRLSRNPNHGVILRDELDKHHVTLESVTEDIERSPLGEAITYLRGTFAQIEAEKIRERTMRGKMARVSEGRLPNGTGIGIYGYAWDKAAGKRLIIDHEASVVQSIFRMALDGLSVNRIATYLNSQGIKSKSGSLWHPLTVRRILNNPTYTGQTYFGQSKRVGKTKVVAQPKESWILLPDITPPIITQETFDLTQEAIKTAKAARPVKANAAYLLTSFVRCPKCGSPVTGTTLNRKYRYYKCRGSVPTATRDKICDAGYIKADDLEESVWNKLLDMMSSPLTLLKTLMTETDDQSASIIQSLDRDINKLRKKIKTYPRKEQNLYDLLSSDAVTKDYVLDAVNKLKQERSSDEHQLKQLIMQRNQASQADQLKVTLNEASGRKFMQFVHDYQPDRSLYPPPEVDDPDYAQQQFAKKRDLLSSIRLKVLADPDNFEFDFTLDGVIHSSRYADDHDSFTDQLLDFQDQHPGVSVRDLLDPNTVLQEDSPFATRVNRLKGNLVTIEQTSA